jgi:hypothetical protein
MELILEIPCSKPHILLKIVKDLILSHVHVKNHIVSKNTVYVIHSVRNVFLIVNAKNAKITINLEINKKMLEMVKLSLTIYFTHKKK